MKNKAILFITIFILVFLSLNHKAQAQSTRLFVPKSLEKIYNGVTRNWDGKPGADYWINKAEYNIKALINVDSSSLFGNDNIIYYNNSPDSLDMLVIQLFQNRFKPGSQKDNRMNPEAFTKGLQITNFSINDSVIILDSITIFNSSTNLFLKLPHVLAPGENVKLSFEYNFQIQEVSPGRMGKYAEGVYDIAYWYPKIAVYDDVHGWDTENYAGSLEFYSDFSDYNFEITVPANYTVWATGDLQNYKEVLPKIIADRYKEASKSKDVVRIITTRDYSDGLFSDSTNSKTWEFAAKNVADVSFSMSDHYLWDGQSVIVDSLTGRTTFAQAAYPDSTINWDKAAEITAESVSFLSHQMPGVPYPYSHMTSFCNGRRGGGMETPMMANDGAPEEFSRFVSLLCHEIAHTYFPFYMGINERNYAWMDEGWASYFPTDFVPQFDSTYSHYQANFSRAKKIFGSEANIPLMVPTKFLRSTSLYFNAYRHAFAAYSSLNDLLGNKLFKKVMKEYIKRWHGKHPIPYDFFFTINDVANKDYSWFINKWFFDFGYCDLALDKKDGNLIVENKGDLPVKVDLVINYKDGSNEVIHKNPAIWKNNINSFIIKPKKDVLSAEILHDEIPDIDFSNNTLMFN